MSSPLAVNLRHLKDKSVVLQGEISAEELQIECLDELVHARAPLKYDVEVEMLESNLLVQGTLKITLECECARCLKPFSYPLTLEDWVCHVPLQGEEAAPTINDCVDLTPYVREDTLLAFPQHPLCKPECGGLPPTPHSLKPEPGGEPKPTASAWAELNKLRFDK